MIEAYMPSRFGVRALPIKRYMTESAFKLLMPKISNVRSYLIKSKTVHGFEVPGTGQILIHPDTAFKVFRLRKDILRKLKIKS